MEIPEIQKKSQNLLEILWQSTKYEKYEKNTGNPRNTQSAVSPLKTIVILKFLLYFAYISDTVKPFWLRVVSNDRALLGLQHDYQQSVHTLCKTMKRVRH